MTQGETPARLQAALQRLDDMIGRRDRRTLQILSFHAAIEQQMDIELGILLPDGAHLRRRLGFAQKIDVLLACADNPFMPDLALALIAFNNLRNCVAHGENKSAVDGHMARLTAELQKTFSRGPLGKVTVHFAAAAIVATLASLNDTDVMAALLGV